MPAARRSGNPATRAAAAKKPPPKKTGGRSLAQYRQEAGGTPFVLEVDDDTSIVIQRPNGDKLMEMSERYAGVSEDNPPSTREFLGDLFGDAYDEVMDVVGKEDHAVLIAVMKDVAEHFGLGEALASLAS